AVRARLHDEARFAGRHHVAPARARRLEQRDMGALAGALAEPVRGDQAGDPASDDDRTHGAHTVRLKTGVARGASAAGFRRRWRSNTMHTLRTNSRPRSVSSIASGVSVRSPSVR